MNVKELTIGSFVRTRRLKTIKVESISTKRQHRKLGYHTDDDHTHIKYVRIDQVYPIPLDARMLQTNGWWHLEGLGECTTGWGTKHGDYTITYISYAGLPVLTIEQDNLMEYRTCVTLVDEVYNVHNLLNAYRLCGLNELADKFKIE